MLQIKTVFLMGCILFAFLSPAQADIARWDLPMRPELASSGNSFLNSLKGLDQAEVERRIFHEISSGNVPNFLRKLAPVRISLGGNDFATVFVTPDYLGVGGVDDFVRLPMTLGTAQKLAKSGSFSLPNRAIVDAIYNQAAVKLTPKPLPPVRGIMTKPTYWEKHSSILRAQLLGSPADGLVAGHKKDIVLPANGVLTKLTIYGWHRSKNRPIQPESQAHGVHYVDYSHGVRLVSDRAIFKGKEIPLKEVLDRANRFDQGFEIDANNLW